MDKAFQFEKKIAVLSETDNKVTLLALVSWYGKPAKLEVREWPKDFHRGFKGIPLTDLEAAILRDELIKLDLPAPGVSHIQRERARAAAEAAEKTGQG